MVLLENEQFLSELSKLYQKVKTAGTVQVTMKRYDGRTKPVPTRKTNSSKTKKGAAAAAPEPAQPSEYSCLIRATSGSRKISTVIGAKDMNKFQLAYSNLVRGNIELNKKEKKADAKGAKNASSKNPAGHSKATQ
jgi:signal recognition particle subunit SRP14